VWWYTTLVSAIQETEGSWFKASLGKVSLRPSQKNKLKGDMAQMVEALS
jgi:hypothetical protein